MKNNRHTTTLLNLSGLAKFLLLTLIFSFLSCRKDVVEVIGKGDKIEPVTYSNWNAVERRFFSLDNSSGKIDKRAEGNLQYRPLLIEAYNALAESNQTTHFVDTLVRKIGYPNWAMSHVYFDRQSKQAIINIPFAFDAENKTTAIITVNRIHESSGQIRFVWNGASRQELKNAFEQGKCYKKTLIGELVTFDKSIFGIREEQVQQSYCNCEETQNPPPPPLDPDCPWKLKEICNEGVTNTYWIGGIYRMPPHLDHDRDGIPNHEDQDWPEWSQRHHATEQDLYNFYAANWEAVYLTTYDDFWKNFNNYFPEYIYSPENELTEQEWGIVFGTNSDDEFSFGEVFEALWDEIEDLWSSIVEIWEIIDDFFDSLWEYIYDPGEGCPWEGAKGKQETRTVTCKWFYIKDCSGYLNIEDWFHDFGGIIPCDACNEHDVQYELNLRKFYVDQFIDNYRIDWLTYSQVYQLAILCDISQSYQSEFDECLKSALRDYAFEQENATLVHNYLNSFYSDYFQKNLDLNGFLAQYGNDKFLATASLYEAYITEVGTSPTDPYMWQLMMEVLYDELGPLALELIPGGVGDLIGAYNDYKSGNYWSASLGIVLTVIPLNEISKAYNKYPEIKKGFKAVYKIVYLWNKLLTLPGGQKVLNKLPQAWKNLPGSKLADGNGLYWKMTDYFNLRIMDGNPKSKWVNQQKPYVRLVKNGSRLDKYGNPIQSNNPDFEELTHIPITEITDGLLDIFFN